MLLKTIRKRLMNKYEYVECKRADLMSWSAFCSEITGKSLSSRYIRSSVFLPGNISERDKANNRYLHFCFWPLTFHGPPQLDYVTRCVLRIRSTFESIHTLKFRILFLSLPVWTVFCNISHIRCKIIGNNSIYNILMKYLYITVTSVLAFWV